MILLLIALFCIWNFGMVLIIAGRINKLNNHHHGGFTEGRKVEFRD